jgi:aromatic ring-opening dioxygenase LigB subunit
MPKEGAMPQIDLAYAVPHPPILVDGIGSADDFAEARATREAYMRFASEVVADKPEVLIIATPHGRIYADSMHLSNGAGASGDWLDFGRDPQRYYASFDEEYITALTKEATAADIPCDASPDQRLDHGTLVPLHFLTEAGYAGKIIRISISLLGDDAHYRMGRCIDRVAAALNRRAIFVASGDLSHRLKSDGPYGFNPAGPAFDKRISQMFANGDLGSLRTFTPQEREAAGECGLNSNIMLAGVFDGSPVTSELYSYEGPWGVGYAIARFARARNDQHAQRL